MVRSFLLAFALLFALTAFPQFEYTRMLKASATLAPGFMLKEPQTNIYVHGHLEYFAEDRVSLRGDGFWFTGAQQKPALLAQNSTLLFGALYHVHTNRLDWFIGLQPGVSLTRPAVSYTQSQITMAPTTVIVSDTSHYELKVLPALSPVTGITFYAARFVNFFLEVRYVSGRYFGYEAGRALKMSELRLSAGLGFQLPLKKKS
jgi:hypothetical protein